MPGTPKTIAQLEAIFVTGAIPTQQDYYDFFASFPFYTEPKAANLFFAGPVNGADAPPTFRSLVAADIPTLAYWPLAGSAVLTNDFDITLNDVTNTHTFSVDDTAIQFRSVVTGFNEYSNIYSGGSNALISRFNSIGSIFNFMNVSDAGIDFETNAISFTIGGSPGTNGQVLTSNGTNATWQTGGSLSALTAATATNTINNASYAQEWQWDTLGAGTGLTLSSSATDAASNTQTVFRVNQDGVNASSTQTTYSGYFSNTKTGTASTNVGLYAEASGGTTNIAAHLANGEVRFGNDAQDTQLKFSSSGIGSNRFWIYTTGDAMFFANGTMSSPSTTIMTLRSSSVSFTQNFIVSNTKEIRTSNNRTAFYFTEISGNTHALIGVGAAPAGDSRFDIRGTGTTSNKAFRIADSGNSEKFYILDGGDLYATSSIGQHTLRTTVSSTVVGLNSQGSSTGVMELLTGATRRQRLFWTTAAGTYFETGWLGIGGAPAANTVLHVRGTGETLLGGTAITADAILDLQSTTKAFIPPRMTEAERDAIPTPSIGMVIYNTTTNLLNFHNGSAWGAI